MRQLIVTSKLLVLLSFLGGAPRASAQGNPPGTVTVTAAVSGFHHTRADLEPGGDVKWSTTTLGAGVMRQFVPAFAAGLSLRHVNEDWRFASTTAFGGSAPWRELRRSSVGLNLSLALSRTLLINASPSVEWAYDQRAGTSDAATYGAHLGVAKVIRPERTLGGGASVRRQFYSVKISPFVIVNWKLTEQLKLANAPSTSPEGGGGVELRWANGPNWELAAGGVIKSDRYRLPDTGAYPAHIGETSSMPMFARISRKLGPRFKADVYGGALVNGRLRIKDPDGDEVTSVDHRTAPAVAATLSFRQ